MARASYEVSHPEFMHIQKEGGVLYGCNQDWYRIEFRRRAGCGPVAATNILLHMRKKYDIRGIPYQNGDVSEALDAMNDVFLYVRPRRRGLNTVKKFVNGMCRLGHKYGLSFRYKYMLVPPQADIRPDLGAIVRFIEEGLCNDAPVAFLNLHAGDVEEQLSSWHWVTVVGISKEADDVGLASGTGADDVGLAGCTEAAEDATSDDRSSDNTTADDRLTENAIADDGLTANATAKTVTLRFYDQSKCIDVDLCKWLDTTQKGGGFAFFHKPTLWPAHRAKRA